jgi:hypothetical protein
MNLSALQTVREAESIDPAQTILNESPSHARKAHQVLSERAVAEMKRRLNAAGELYRAAQCDTVGG